MEMSMRLFSFDDQLLFIHGIPNNDKIARRGIDMVLSSNPQTVWKNAGQSTLIKVGDNI